MKITVCIGSSCHELGGTFCMGKCQQGVCVTVDGALFSVSPESVKEFFEKQVKAKLA